MILRIQSPEGTKRVETTSSESTESLFKKISELFDSTKRGDWTLYSNRKKTNQIIGSRTRNVSYYNFRHGDMLYLRPSTANTRNMALTGNTSQNESHDTIMTEASDITMIEKEGSSTNLNKEDDVDVLLGKEDGKIIRKKDEQNCRHNDNATCVYCTPLDPWDEDYLKEKGIKFLSFHAYVRKMKSGIDRGKFAIFENLSLRIKPDCPSHAPWPKAICTKCQPNTVFLKRQEYRHVDLVLFENHAIVKNFLSWLYQAPLTQRVGILYGFYEKHESVPLGIKVRVAAIYEPPQICHRNSVEFLDDPNASAVISMGMSLGLRPVGWIFTDLIPHPRKTNKYKHFRGTLETHFLSAHELITAAKFQNMFPNPCSSAPHGHFGSKFVTVVVTGGKDDNIDMQAYQVTNQCMALVGDNCLVPTKDAPELAYMRDSSKNQYVPDAFYTRKNEYDKEELVSARPLPVEYLLVDIPVSTPKQEIFTLGQLDSSKEGFPIENREDKQCYQNMDSFRRHLSQYPNDDDVVKLLSDFHFLIFLATSDIIREAFPVEEDFMTLKSRIYEAVRLQDLVLALDLQQGRSWQHLVLLSLDGRLSAKSNRSDGVSEKSSLPIGTSNTSNSLTQSSTFSKGSKSSVDPTEWQCQTCTFLNDSFTTKCQMCEAPKDT